MRPLAAARDWRAGLLGSYWRSGTWGKDLPAKAGDMRATGSIPGLGRSPRGGHVNPLQCSYLENPMDREAWWATVHGVAKSRTGLKRLAAAADRAPRAGLMAGTRRGWVGGIQAVLCWVAAGGHSRWRCAGLGLHAAAAAPGPEQGSLEV